MPDTPPSPTPPLPPVPRARGILPWLIGLFALWQLVFVPLTNLLEFVPLRPTRYDTDPPIETTQRWGRFTDIEALQWTTEAAAFVLVGWAEATGQDQGWNMFTPGFPPYTVVPAVEFRFPDGATDRVSSRFEPPDPANPRPRPPLLHDREFNFEANIVMLAWDCHPKTLAEQPDRWRRLPERVRENESLLTRWLSWKTRQYQAAHPHRAGPVEVVLLLRYLPTPLPEDLPRGDRRQAFERPFARWFPGAPAKPGYLPLEGYDPVARRYVRLKRWE
jgi:hypothetical protein